MEWPKLLSARRLGKEASAADAEPPPRTAFTRDYDRIIFSSAFRRLQDKTQVFPLAKNDYVRTRLTHSLEVASVGRSLGIMAAGAIIRGDSALASDVSPHDIGNIVATACLAHDIGNPPFGHSGESAIQEWFATSSEAHRWLAEWQLSAEEKADLLTFEGNAQGFRTLCTLQAPDQRGGLQLTCAVLAAFTKYPRASTVDASQITGISGKKFGFMQAERALFEEVASEVGLIRKPGSGQSWCRHPLAFLVEAADDICYHVMDVEDGFKAGALSFNELYSLHEPWLDAEKLQRAEQIAEEQRKAEYFRAITVNALTRGAAAVFESNLAGLMTGAFDSELTAHMEHAIEFAAFKEVAKRQVYNARQVLEIEACGFEVIAGLLAAFLGAVENKARNADKPSARARALLGLMPGGNSSLCEFTAYQRAIRVTDFVAGMTDSYAVMLYQRIRGIELP
jgi:dGTPase